MEHSVLFDALLVASIPAVIAAVAAITSARISAKNRKSMDTGNDRPIGETVHDMAQQQEIAAAIQHTNTRELVQVAEHVVRVEDKIDGWIQESTKVHESLIDRLEKISATQKRKGGTK